MHVTLQQFTYLQNSLVDGGGGRLNLGRGATCLAHTSRHSDYSQSRLRSYRVVCLSSENLYFKPELGWRIAW